MKKLYKIKISMPFVDNGKRGDIVGYVVAESLGQVYDYYKDLPKEQRLQAICKVDADSVVVLEESTTS